MMVLEVYFDKILNATQSLDYLMHVQYAVQVQISLQ
jgi:hypothetical protein